MYAPADVGAPGHRITGPACVCGSVLAGRPDTGQADKQLPRGLDYRGASCTSAIRSDRVLAEADPTSPPAAGDHRMSPAPWSRTCGARSLTAALAFAERWARDVYTPVLTRDVLLARYLHCEARRPHSENRMSQRRAKSIPYKTGVPPGPWASA